MQLHSHHHRSRVVAEMHVRPSPVVTAPATITQLLRLVTECDREAEQDWLDRLPFTQRHEDGSGRSLEGTLAEASHLFWERHSEGSTVTLIDRSANLNHSPPAWIADQPGEIMRASKTLVTDDEVVAQQWIAALELAPAHMVCCQFGEATLWTDFRLHADGFGYQIICNQGLASADLGRLVQRLQELGNYRNLTMLGLEVARDHGPSVDALEQRHLDIVQQLQSDDHNAVALDALIALAADVQLLVARTAYRMSATLAYADIVNDRLAALDCERVAGFQTLADFTERRILPAVRTCRSFSDRLRILGERINATTAQLRTRIELGIQHHNRDLLASMEQSARHQVQLQHLVEGLSVIGVSYYLIGIVGYLFKGFFPKHGILGADQALAALAIPIVILTTIMLRRRVGKVTATLTKE